MIDHIISGLKIEIDEKSYVYF